jgi:AcrR family transcriptional regulator
MRSLADRLGVTPAALYYWFPSKAYLLAAIAEHVAAQIVATEERGGRWEDRLRSLARGIVDAAQHHPATFSWVIQNYATQPPLTRLHEAMLDVLLDAGFDAREAVLARSTVLRFVVGHLGLSAVPGHIDPTTVDVDSYPRIHEVAAQSARLTPSDILEYGLDHVIAGLVPPRSGRHRPASRPSGTRVSSAKSRT